MKKIVTITALTLALAGCAADPPEAPMATPQFGSPQDPQSCTVKHDQTPCNLTNQQAFIEILRLSQANVLYPNQSQPKSWQEMLEPLGVLPPRPASKPSCPACTEGTVLVKGGVK